ncbi:MAG TPA: S9 family peptidase [Burkholderiaceae bacterium]|nr:S9 family peptidase [Burkholderiaceae bacterium]
MTYRVADHIALRRVERATPSPDGRWLAVEVKRLSHDGSRYLSDIWRVPTDGSAATRLTRGECNDSAPCFRHDGALAFLSDRRPTEGEAAGADDEAKRKQVWILPVEGGEPRQLTDEPLGVDAFKFAARGDRLAYLAPVLRDVPLADQRKAAEELRKKGPSGRRYRRQPVRHWDDWLQQGRDRPVTHLIACNAQGGGRRDLTPEFGCELAIEPDFDVSPDGRRIAVTPDAPGADRELDRTIWVADLQTDVPTLLGAGVAVRSESVRFSPDGDRLATVRSRRSAQSVERPTLVIHDLAAGTERDIGAAWDRWPHVEDWTGDGRALIVTADDDGHVPLFRIELDSGSVERLGAGGDGRGGTHDGCRLLADGRIAGVRSTLLSPPETFVCDAVGDATPRPLAALSGFDTGDASAWAEVETMRIASTDGAPVHGVLVKPRGARGKLPTLLWIHGGPIGMWGDGWHWRWNPLIAVAAGYAVALPNPRGSTGFGQAWIQGIWGNTWGAQCYEDLMAFADALAARPDIDPQRMMAMGGSFGGYMTNWIGTQTRRFRCLVTHASIVGMATFTGVTDHPPWWYLEMGGLDPYADQASFDRYAPWTGLRHWRTPTLIIHGERDYRCPIGEALMLFEALQYHGVESELLVFPDENHWILKPGNIVQWYDAVFDFIGRHLEKPA